MADPQLIGAAVVDLAGLPIGSVLALLVEPETRQGRWLLVELATGEAGASRAVPLAAASVDGQSRLILPWSAAAVAASPVVGRTLSQDEHQALTAYYESAPA